MIDNERNGRRNIGKLLSEVSGESKVWQKVNPLNVAHWNIEGNIYKHETEIEKLLVEENIDIMFLNKTNNRYIDTEFKILSYKAYIHHN